jgi:hypothetical protein
MYFRLPLPHRGNTCYSEFPLQRERHLLAGPQHYSLEDALRDFRDECAPGGKQTGKQTWESGRRYMTHAGFRVRSKAEKIIADYLSQGGIRFLYEPVLRLGDQLVRPDFFLSDYDLPYEHFGLNTTDYLWEAEAKIALYHRARMPFMYTTFLDEPDIEDVIVDKLAEATLNL